MSEKARKVLKILSIAVVIGLILVLIGACINLYVIHTGGKRIYSVKAMRGSHADCILVLGAGLKPDGSPSDMLRDRLSFAYDLWQEGVSDTVLISGDRASESYDEVTAMKNYLLAHGVPEEAIVEDPMGYSTSESLIRAKEVYGYENIVVVTHLPIADRSCATCANLPHGSRTFSSFFHCNRTQQSPSEAFAYARALHA